MGLRSVVKDYPLAATIAAGGIVGVHCLAYDKVSWLPEVARRMAAFADAWQVYLGFAAVVAVSAGFSGVILVFALEQSDERFRRLRRLGGARLSANWFSPARVSLVAAFASVLCSVAAASGHGLVAWWAFEFVLLWSALSAIRLLWLLGILARVVAAVDDDAQLQSERGANFDLAAHLAGRQESPRDASA